MDPSKTFLFIMSQAITVLTILSVADSAKTEYSLSINAAMLQMKENLNNAFTACQTEMGLKDENFMKFAAKITDSPDKLHDYGCGLACMAEHIGITTADKLDEDKLLKELEKIYPAETTLHEITMTTIHHCLDTTAAVTDKCDRMSGFLGCEIASLTSKMSAPQG